MIYFWKIVMDNGKEYVVKSPISSTKKFAEMIFSDPNGITITSFPLKDGGDVMIVCRHVSSIEYNMPL
jgi:hypothetical protein|nr:MAG TPA: hypothetical protein [Caudoviricetes sp.]